MPMTGSPDEQMAVGGRRARIQPSVFPVYSPLPGASLSTSVASQGLTGQPTTASAGNWVGKLLTPALRKSRLLVFNSSDSLEFSVWRKWMLEAGGTEDDAKRAWERTGALPFATHPDMGSEIWLTEEAKSAGGDSPNPVIFMRNMLALTNGDKAAEDARKAKEASDRAEKDAADKAQKELEAKQKTGTLTPLPGLTPLPKPPTMTPKPPVMSQSPMNAALVAIGGGLLIYTISRLA